jgi:hypothetical protein
MLFWRYPQNHSTLLSQMTNNSKGQKGRDIRRSTHCTNNRSVDNDTTFMADVKGTHWGCLGATPHLVFPPSVIVLRGLELASRTQQVAIGKVCGRWVQGGVRVSGGGCPGDAPDRPPSTHGWGVSNNLPSDVSRSVDWDNFLSQEGAWVAWD